MLDPSVQGGGPRGSFSGHSLPAVVHQPSFNEIQQPFLRNSDSSVHQMQNPSSFYPAPLQTATTPFMPSKRDADFRRPYSQR